MKSTEWKEFISTWTAALAERKTHNPNEPRALHPTHGLGFPGATEADLVTAESRLGTRLPRSYREFLKATNGLKQPFSYVPACGGDFWPAAGLDWFSARNAEWINAYEGVDDGLVLPSGTRFVDELRGTLELSHDGDAAVYLLNPRVIGPDDEWETWFFASWAPEVERFHSFEDMMRARYHQFMAGVGDGF